MTGDSVAVMSQCLSFISFVKLEASCSLSLFLLCYFLFLPCLSHCLEFVLSSLFYSLSSRPLSPGGEESHGQLQMPHNKMCKGERVATLAGTGGIEWQREEMLSTVSQNSSIIDPEAFTLC